MRIRISSQNLFQAYVSLDALDSPYKVRSCPHLRHLLYLYLLILTLLFTPLHLLKTSLYLLLHNQNLSTPAMSVSDRQPRRWTPVEDQTLREQVDAQSAQGGSRDWCQIALALPGRSNKDCRKRWHNSVTDGLKKGQWSKSEDQLLTHGVQHYGYQWTKVATCVTSRSADQCAKRWQQSLDPSLDRSEWRENEDTALLTAVESLGRHWKDIQEQYLPHRSKNCVKNRYSVLTRRSAVHLAPYDDNLGSSSSEAGTPMQMESGLPLDSMSMSFAPNTTQRLYQPDRVSHASSTEPYWPWSGISDPSMTLPTSSFDPFDASPWLAYHNALPSNASQYGDVQSNMATRQETQYPTMANQQLHFHPYQTHHQPSMPSPNQYTTASAPSHSPYALTARPYNPHSRRGAHGYPYRGS